MTAVDITLSNAEIWRAAQVGAWRQCDALRKGHVAFNGGRSRLSPWEAHIEGAGAELVVAKFLNLYWDCYAEDLTKIKADVGTSVEVRSAYELSKNLLCQKKDFRQKKWNNPFVLVLGKIPALRIVGWAYGWEVMQNPYWDVSLPRPAWNYPQSSLKPVSDLKAVLRGQGIVSPGVTL
jgi:hypothetical protein